MFANQNQRQDFADTRSGPADSGLASAFTFAGLSRIDSNDAADQLAQADAADSHLLRLVMCVACATLSLALVSSLA